MLNQLTWMTKKQTPTTMIHANSSSQNSNDVSLFSPSYITYKFDSVDIGHHRNGTGKITIGMTS